MLLISSLTPQCYMEPEINAEKQVNLFSSPLPVNVSRLRGSLLLEKSHTKTRILSMSPAGAVKQSPRPHSRQAPALRRRGAGRRGPGPAPLRQLCEGAGPRAPCHFTWLQEAREGALGTAALIPVFSYKQLLI